MKKLTLEQFILAHGKQGEELTGTQFAAAVALYNSYEMGYNEGVISIEKVLDKISPGFEEISDGNKEMLQNMLTLAAIVYGTANKAYERGEADKANGKSEIFNTEEFLTSNPTLKDECCGDVVDILFSAYVKGYRGIKPLPIQEESV